MLVDKFVVDSPNVTYTDEAITATYEYQNTALEPGPDGKWVVRPTTTTYEFKTQAKVPKLG